MRGRVGSSPVHRLRRLIPEGPVERGLPAPPPRPRPLRVAVAALWIGMITGPLEVGLVLALKPLRDPTPGLFHMNRHLLWSIPLFHLSFFAILGGVLALLARFRSRFSVRRGAFLLLFAALLSLSLAVKSLHPSACAILSAGLAFRMMSRGESVFFGSGRAIRATIPWTSALVLGLFSFSIGREVWAERQGLAHLPVISAASPNVVLIVMDTVGANHMSLYGYHRETTPNLVRIAREGIRFDQARSPAPWTLPSHASMFTGRWPHQLSAGFDGPLGADEPTLAEFLRDRGYVTGGFIANTLYCSAETGLNRGFLHYEDHPITAAGVVHSAALGQRLLEKSGARAWRLLAGETGFLRRIPGRPDRAQPDHRPRKPYKDASEISRDALAWLSHHEGRPFFLFLNLFDAHTPYLLPEGSDEHFGLAPQGRSDYAILDDFWQADKRRLSPRDVALAQDAYDDCIAYMDQQIGRLYDDLDRRGLLGNTLIIVTADHGEQFGEHGLFGHAGSLYRPEVHVPLLIVPPAGRAGGRVVPEPVSLRDLPATVVDLLGRTGASPFPGSSLARRWDPAHRSAGVPDDPVLSEVQSPATNNANQGRSPVFRGPMSSLVAEGKVYIRNGDGIEELYDLGADPTESHNLAGSPEAQPVLEVLRSRLRHAAGVGTVRKP